LDERGFHDQLLHELGGRRGRDGGFPTGAGGRSEVEPTALATLALRDGDARDWLAARQRSDGGLGEPSGRHDGPTTAALAALALPRDAARRALGFAVGHPGLPLPGAGDAREGWGWTADTRSFVEPTSRVLIAQRLVAPEERSVHDVATRLLRDWQCRDGGWNHGVATVLGDHLVGYAQTTAFALIALRGETSDFVERGLAFLRRRWRQEAGRLTVAQAAIAFRFHGVGDEVGPALETLETLSRRRQPRASTVALAWSALATGTDDLLAPLRGRS
jgi:hypothetical protein